MRDYYINKSSRTTVATLCTLPSIPYSATTVIYERDFSGCFDERVAGDRDEELGGGAALKVAAVDGVGRADGSRRAGPDLIKLFFSIIYEFS